MKKAEIAIIGAGPAGLTAAIYAQRAGRKVVILEKMAAGGQMLESRRIDNYPGVEQADGAKLAATMRAQAVAAGAELELAEATGVQKTAEGFKLETDEGEIAARAVIICTGVTARRMEVAGEAELIGRGVSFCTTCDAPLYAGKVVGVYGGGNSAVNGALELARVGAKKVFLIYRGNNLRAEQALIQRAQRVDNIEFWLNTEIAEVLGEGRLIGVRVRGECGERGGHERRAIRGIRGVHGGSLSGPMTSDLALDGLFVQIGRTADTEWCGDLVKRDADGYIITGADGSTATPGLYAAGDICAKTVRQITTAVGSGAVAGRGASEYLG